MGRVSNRSDDERLLAWMQLRTDGMSSYEIATQYGVRPEKIRVATHRAKAADIAESGEPEHHVCAGYWT